MRLTLVVVFGCLMSMAVTGMQVVPDPSEAPLWHTAARGRGMPAVLEDRVFVTTTDHSVVALSLSDGRQLWQRSTGESGRSTEGSRVVADAGRVVAGDWDLYAFNAGTGEPAWAFHPSDGYGPGLFLGQTMGGRVFAGSPSGSIYAVDLATGRQLWRAVVDDRTLTSVFEPATNGRIVVAGYTVFSTPNTGGVVAVDAVSGKEQWRLRFPALDDGWSTYSAGGAVITADLAFVASGDGYVWAIELETGRVRWKVPPLAGPISGIITTTNRELRSLGVEGGRLIVGSLTGYVVAYDIATEREVWRSQNGWLGSVGLDDFSSGNGVVYVPYTSGFLLALDVTSGALLWQTKDYTQGFAWPPAVATDRVIAAGATGFWAFRPGSLKAAQGERR